MISNTIRILQHNSVIVKNVSEMIRPYHYHIMHLAPPFTYDTNISTLQTHICDLQSYYKQIRKVYSNVLELRNLKTNKLKYIRATIRRLLKDIIDITKHYENTIQKMESEKMFTEEAFQWSINKQLPVSGIQQSHQHILEDVNLEIYNKFKSYCDYDLITFERTLEYQSEDYPNLYWYRDFIINDIQISPYDKEEYLKLLSYFDVRFLVSVTCIESIAYNEIDKLWKPLYNVDKRIYYLILDKLKSMVNYH